MPKITINEIDLTTASYQPAETDIAYVPGFSVNDDATNDLIFCETVSEFEKAFGTAPRMLSDSVATTHKEGVLLELDISTYTSHGFNSSMTFTSTIVGTTVEWRYGKKGVITVENGLKLGIPAIGITATFDNESDSWSDNDVITVTPVYDLSYVYAKELIRAGIPVVYQVVDTSQSGVDQYSAEAMRITLADSSKIYTVDSMDGIMDKGEFSIKYLTSGAYPSFIYSYNPEPDPEDPEDTYYNFDDAFAQDMLTLAEARGDCVALIDPTAAACGALYGYAYTDENGYILTSPDDYVYVSNSEDMSLDGPGSVWEAAKTFADSATGLSYGTMFSPWGIYTTQSSYTTGGVSNPDLDSVIMPPSYGYLMALARSIRTNNNWLAVAGIARGQVPYLNSLYTAKRLSNSIAEKYQPRNGETSINAITNIKPYGLTIWGNRTMKNNEDASNGGEDGLTATSFLNIRNMVSDVKKTAYNAAKTLMFEQNSDVLWVNFCSMITPLLDQLMSGQGLSNYKIIKEKLARNGQKLPKAMLRATIKLWPIYAVEEFEITVELLDEDVSVLE